MPITSNWQPRLWQSAPGCKQQQQHRRQNGHLGEIALPSDVRMDLPAEYRRQQRTRALLAVAQIRA